MLSKKLGGFFMRCKITRRRKKEKLKIYQTFFKELQRLNPKQSFSIEQGVAQVEKQELWKLNMPEGSNVFIGKNKEDFKTWGYLAIRYQQATVYIYGW